ncbi:NADH/Ubiquinone/plastoquinone (Complex I) [uncultured delta proteobacterium]|uniref:NADH/Ubiquinone/plastoquinone (Complex I) n=1 Tax=uncultured delta proteobacterium TaxID=34034 RepID=A0A212KHJ6_9DELT|nr:NADH/Ubiquinone/plastoquinone (Complex I) [uncultured delta proteobacterium]
MAFLLASLGLFFAGGCAALASGRGQNASRIGAVSAIAASLAGLVPALLLLAGNIAAPGASPLSQTLGKLPMGVIALHLDLLSALFLVPVLLLVAVAAFYGMGNGNGSGENPDPGYAKDRVAGHAGAHWFFYNLLAGGMVLTLTAADTFLFLLAWELMSLTPFFLITMNGSSAETRSAAWIYLVAAHLGALFLLAFFALLAAKNGGSLSFAAFVAGAANLEPGIRGGSGLLFILAVIGFGAKTGLMPLHVWMPEAYPAAPSHVAAVMSGAAVNMGVYGIIRAFGFLGAGEAWWAYILIVAGLFSAAAGILLALAQSSIKRSLAFSSVENMGIIFLALGIALLCLQGNHAGAAALAATGALVHMLNHALSKGLLFLCAGCVLRGTGTVSLRLLGGLQKRLPVVGWCFVFGSAAIAALPPLNGFAGEFFIYLGMMFGGIASAGGPSPEYSLIFWVCLFILAAVGGLTLLCFSRLYGMAFLGAPRTEAVQNAQPPARNEMIAVCIMAALCMLSALAAPRVAQLSAMAAAPAFSTTTDAAPVLAAAPARAAGSAARFALVPEGFIPPRLAPGPNYSGGPDSAITLLQLVNNIFLLLAIAVLAAFCIRRRCLRERTIGASPTWDCGYLAPTARIQYTAGSFSQPAAFFLRTILRQKFTSPGITEYFPLKAKATVATPDWIETRGFAPLFTLVSRIADKCKELQHGRANGYILYILVTLVALLAWKLE